MAILDGAQSTLSYGAVTIANLISVSPVSVTREAIETTAKGDTVKSFRASSQPDGGQISFSAYYDPAHASHDGLIDLYASQATQAWVATLSDGTTISVSNGFLQDFSIEDTDIDGNVVMNGTVKCNVIPVIAAGV